jgi:hypothetical protein
MADRSLTSAGANVVSPLYVTVSGGSTSPSKQQRRATKTDGVNRSLVCEPHVRQLTLTANGLGCSSGQRRDRQRVNTEAVLEMGPRLVGTARLVEA